MAFGSVTGVKNILRSAPVRGDEFIVVGSSGQYDISESEIETLLDEATDLIIKKFGFTPAASPILNLAANYFAAYHAYMRVFSSGAEPLREIPEQIREWRITFEDIIEDAEIRRSLQTETAEDLLEPDILCSDIVRVQDEGITLTDTNDSYLDVTPVLNHTEIVRDGKKGTGTLYVRGTDYEIWYPTGRIRRTANSSIESGKNLYVTYYGVRKRAFVEKLEGEVG